MMDLGLSERLVDALKELAINIPELLPTIQERLLDEVSIVLAHQPFWGHPGTSSITFVSNGNPIISKDSTQVCF